MWTVKVRREERGERREERGAKVEVRLKEKIPGVFWPVHQAIRRGEVTEVVAKGGRGSGKSSYLSMELVWQLLRHPDCHAVVLAPRVGLPGIAFACAFGWCVMLAFEVPYYFWTCREL